MRLTVFPDKNKLAEAAAAQASDAIRRAIRERNAARIIAVIGASQFEFLENLTKRDGIDWEWVEMFHFDEYIGLPISHPASFRKYLLDRLINKVGISRYHLLDGERVPSQVIADVSAEIRKAPIDVAFVGIGENGHLAFNDPPADFETEEPYIVVTLDEACRKQQMGEGWFATFADVPQRAISMSIKQIMKTRQIIGIVPDARKAKAIKACFDGDVSPLAPASILQRHPNTTICLDNESASLLSRATLEAYSA